jgi:hypothetical protein
LRARFIVKNRQGIRFCLSPLGHPIKHNRPIFWATDCEPIRKKQKKGPGKAGPFFKWNSLALLGAILATLTGVVILLRSHGAPNIQQAIMIGKRVAT